MKKKVKNLDELKAVAGSFLQAIMNLPAKDTAIVVGLSGDLGAGKTAFTKCVASLLNIKDTVTSPTFILEKVYEIPADSIVQKRFSKLVHIDAYRLEKGEEMRGLGWGDLLADPKNLILLEWPEQVESALPKDITTLSFKYIDESTRSMEGDLI